ncbi:dTDP-4-dehydrorhamnose 3,5-epimerase [Solemya velum gill symbiont]|uniref:dTDP-4-dehydrorhamnose 3,5-epimerase n=1 Tax=Solemya velum gill symbiont TaxID=2340 RepID=UPI0009969303|nr:dTDP-4-dehydrorhamnose 3,5-epimerase [Solemya velum gill symbiont]OOY52458.1 dTDP-4-dehydrorhamnose 3,5-epimerase [Solemya velum gill symbiont]OOY54554.1 dTDP-4-dehydrorhamnose 3,5-epimerase [Solemya velum gill symbiont]OOY55092.1 dTDP-4-dehydrorhamnose 3,5-epimerase [Solemya velum gill symbiont]OOY60646.1 dTDP-4-dehydrorhamnose 3,5-epimerase [Solemya velum gill symbiont]OOY62552.1 dTDP-4-dehydrorhamnose 3,5-epimerase [Solemya velum gill symbiont]
MKLVPTKLQDAFVIEPTLYGDDRGFFFESFNHKIFTELTGFDGQFVQDNHSRSQQGVLRGLHYQLRQPQGKLVCVVSGEVFDVAVDLRKSSPTFGQWAAEVLSAENKKMFWMPSGFAHGFMVLSESADFLYKTDDYYAPEHERCIQWDDKQLAIDWPLGRIPSLSKPLLSDKDRAGIPFADAEYYA